MSIGNLFDDATTADLIELVRYKRMYGMWPSMSGGVGRTIAESLPIYVSNDSGETIPAYGCMQVTGCIEVGSQNYLVVDKPVDVDGNAGWYLFNSAKEIETGGRGVAQNSTVVRAFKNSGTVTAGDAWRPTINQWYITLGDGTFIACGADDVSTNVLKIFVNGAGGSGSRLYRFTLNASLASGTADADILEMDGTDTTIDDDVLDPLGIFAALTTVGAAGLCILQDGKYYVIQAPCPA